MKTIEKELHKLNFPQILRDLHRNRKTGTLTVNTVDVTKKFYIDRGNVVFASSTDEDDRLGEMLIKLGKITIEQYDRSVELLRETGKRQGTILVELGYLTPKDLVLGVKSQVREIICSLFQVENAGYEFDEGQLPTREVITLQMSMGNLIYEGMKRINNIVRIKREMPDMNDVLKLNEDPASLFQDIVLSPRDKAILAIIDGTKTVKELIDGTPYAAFDAMKTLYILSVAGFVEKQEEARDSEEQVMVQEEIEQPIQTEEDMFEERVNELFSNLYKLSPHDLLGIDATADAKNVESNYYKLVKEFHPDQYISSTDPLMPDKLITISEEIQNAYILLKEDNKRRDYFQAITKPSLEAISNKYAEEHFRSELSKVNEEILSSRDASIETDIEMPRDDSNAQEQTPEVTPVNIEPEDTKPDDAKQELQAEAMAEIEQEEETQERRRHMRFKIHDANVSGEMLFSKEAHLIDISVSGIALKVDGQLRVSKEYFLNLQDKDKVITIKAEVVRSSLIESKTDSTGDIIPLYLVGMEFKNMSPKQADEIIEFINNHKMDGAKIDTGGILSGTRLHARFQIDSTDNNILDLKTCYTVKVLSLGGMLIESEQAISLNDTLQMKISLHENQTINFIGKTVSCRATGIDPERYDIAIEFIEISEEDREKLKTFLQVIADPRESEITSDDSDELKKETTEQPQMNMNESDMPLSHVRYDREPEADRESLSQDAVNLQLLNLIEEIKLLLARLQTELPKTVGHHIPATEKPEEPKEPLSVTGNETIVLWKDISDQEQEVSGIEHKTEPMMTRQELPEHERKALQKEYKAQHREETPKKKKLKLWHIVIPVLFLIAATVSFLFIYTPEKQKTFPQPAQAKKEILTPVQKTQEALPAPAPEVKKVFPAAPAQAVPHTIELIAAESTWLSAAIDEKASKEMILKPGDRIKLTAQRNITLIIGNAAGLKVIFDGKEIGPLGGKGKVVKLQLPLSGNL